MIRSSLRLTFYGDLGAYTHLSIPRNVFKIKQGFNIVDRMSRNRYCLIPTFWF